MKKLLYIFLIFTASVAFADSSNIPLQNISGHYIGSTKYNNQVVKATLDVIQIDDTVRAILSTDVIIKDSSNNKWIGASVLLKGSIKEGVVYLSDYQCSISAPICDKFGQPDKDFIASFQYKVVPQSEKRNDLIIKLKDVQRYKASNDRLLPISNVTFQMKNIDSPAAPKKEIWGNWIGDGYMPLNYFVPIPLPFFNKMRLSLFPETTQEQPFRFQCFQKYDAQSPWYERTDISIVSYNLRDQSIVFGIWDHRYFMKMKDGVFYGLLGYDSDVNRFFDFYGLFWMLPYDI